MTHYQLKWKIARYSKSTPESPKTAARSLRKMDILDRGDTEIARAQQRMESALTGAGFKWSGQAVKDRREGPTTDSSRTGLTVVPGRSSRQSSPFGRRGEEERPTVPIKQGESTTEKTDSATKRQASQQLVAQPKQSQSQGQRQGQGQGQGQQQHQRKKETAPTSTPNSTPSHQESK